MRRGKVSFVLFLIALGLWGLSVQLGPEPSIRPFVLSCEVFAGTLATLSLGLLVFGRIGIPPWFIIDLRGEFPRFHLGVWGFRFTLAAEPMKGGLKLPGFGIFVYVSFLIRLMTKLALALIPLSELRANQGLSVAAGSSLGLFVLLWILERGFYKIFGAEPEDTADETAEEESVPAL